MKRVEQLTTDLLNDLNLMQLPVPVKKVIKAKEINLTSFDLGDEVSGVLVVENGEARIGYNPAEPKVRQRFTLAHELGHYMLHVNNNQNNVFVDGTKVMFRRKESSDYELNRERQANSFAAALLMPKTLIERELAENSEIEISSMNEDRLIAKLASRFSVSQVAMTYRLMNLGYLHR